MRRFTALMPLVSVLSACAPLWYRLPPGEHATISRVGLTPNVQAAQWCRQAAPNSWARNRPAIPAGFCSSVTFTTGLITDASAYHLSICARSVILWLPLTL